MRHRGLNGDWIARTVHRKCRIPTLRPIREVYSFTNGRILPVKAVKTIWGLCVHESMLQQHRCALVHNYSTALTQILLQALFMAAVYNRAGHYIFGLWFLSSFFLLQVHLLHSFFFSSPYLSGLTLDVYHTFTHGVA